MTKHHTLPKDLKHVAGDTKSNDKFVVHGEFPDGLRREAHYLTGPEVLTKLIEYKEAGALTVGYTVMPPKTRTVWGGYDKYS